MLPIANFPFKRALGQSPLQCWDNSTRGLDSATALEFVKNLRLSTEMSGCRMTATSFLLSANLFSASAIVAIYQASQSIYDVCMPSSLGSNSNRYAAQIFDKVAVLYEGRQIYFGEIHAAKAYFIKMGFECPPRQTTADFLTSITSPAERIVRKGAGRTPFTPDEFAAAWHKSDDRAQLLQDIDEFDGLYPIGGEYLEKFKESRRGKHLYTPCPDSFTMLTSLCSRASEVAVSSENTT